MPLWSREEARQWAKKGAAARWSRRRSAVSTPETAQAMAADLDFPTLTLGRVRAQVSGMLDLLDSERARSSPDGQRINWLAAALEKLAELERRLDGRPMPGTLRPGHTSRAERRHRPPAEPYSPPPDPTPADEADEEYNGPLLMSPDLE